MAAHSPPGRVGILGLDGLGDRAVGSQGDLAHVVVDDVRRTTIPAHLGITEAIRAQDPEGALRRMNRHVHAYAEAVREVAERTAIEVANG